MFFKESIPCVCTQNIYSEHLLYQIYAHLYVCWRNFNLSITSIENMKAISELTYIDRHWASKSGMPIWIEQPSEFIFLLLIRFWSKPIILRSGCNLVDKGGGAAMKFRVWIPQRSVVVSCAYVKKPCSVGNSFVTLKEKKANIGSSPGNKAEVSQ